MFDSMHIDLRPLLLSLLFALLSAHSLLAADWSSLDGGDTGLHQAFDCKGKSDEKVQSALLSAVQEQYDKVRYYSADFTQYSYLMALDAREQSSGKVWFQKPGMMKWLYQHPEEQVFLFRDDTFWYFQAYERQLFIDHMKAAFQTDLPLSFLMGIGSLKEHFRISSSCKNEKGVLLTLVPLSASPDEKLSEFKLLIEPHSSFPAGAMIVEISGNSTAILLENIDQKLPDTVTEVFAADFPEGLDVQDNRTQKNSRDDL